MDILSWPPLAIASSLASVGVGMVNAREFRMARVCFVLVSLLLVLPVGDWLWRTSMSWPVPAAVSVAALAVGVALLRSLWEMVARKEARANATREP